MSANEAVLFVGIVCFAIVAGTWVNMILQRPLSEAAMDFAKAKADYYRARIERMKEKKDVITSV